MFSSYAKHLQKSGKDLKREELSRNPSCKIFITFASNPTTFGTKVQLVRWQFDQHAEIICVLRWKSQTVCLICITSLPEEQSGGGLRLYILLLINM